MIYKREYIHRTPDSPYTETSPNRCVFHKTHKGVFHKTHAWSSVLHLQRTLLACCQRDEVAYHQGGVDAFAIYIRFVFP